MPGHVNYTLGMTKRCDTGAKTSQTVECSKDDPHYFEVVKRWGGRTTVDQECLSHAIESEKRGQTVKLIRT